MVPPSSYSLKGLGGVEVGYHLKELTYTEFFERNTQMRKLNSNYRIKDKKKILLFKLAMDNGSFIYTDEDGIESLDTNPDKSSKDTVYTMVREFKKRTDIYATWQGNMLVNPSHICYAIPAMFYEVLEEDLRNL